MSHATRTTDDQAQARRSRRGFLRGLLVGIGAVAAAAGAPAPPPATAEAATPERPEPILYHRTAYMDRYFRSLR
jgi:hypothetical protein